MALRLIKMSPAKYQNGFTPTIHEDCLSYPLSLKKPRHIFVNSMSDTFHEAFPDEFIFKTFAVMEKASRHKFQVLTKRSERLREISPRLPWPENIWMGVTVESDRYLNRIDDLKSTGAAVKFLSLEPLLTSMPALNLNGIHWVIVGGESGPGARPMKPEWVLDIRDQCLAADVPFFFKQWGGVNKKKAGRLLEGREWNEKPSLKTFEQ